MRKFDRKGKNQFNWKRRVKNLIYKLECTNQNVAMLEGLNLDVENWMQMSTRTIATISVKKERIN